MTLKLGTETASLTNWMMSGAKGPEPVIGMGATLLHWTDRSACTITAWDGKVLTLQDDIETRSDSNGMSESQTYNYTPNPNGREHHYRLGRPNLRGERQWERVTRNEKGRWVKSGGHGLLVGERRAYHDYSF